MVQRLTDEELTSLLSDVESDRVERKAEWKGNAPTTGREAVCAFANDLPNHGQAGVLFVGADDSGAPTGSTVSDELLCTLGDVKTDGQILPPPTMFVERRVLMGCELAVVTVFPADAPPVRYKGRVFIRIGARKGIANAQDERILNERRRYRDLPFDIQPLPSCPFSEIDGVLFAQEYLPGAFAPDVLEANERSAEQRLAACRLIAGPDDATPTVLGVLVLGKAPREWLPGAYVQFLRVDGNDWGDPVIDEAVLDGPISQVLRRVDEKIDAHNRIAVDFTGHDTEIRSFSYPKVALQQIIRNAVMHRTYENTNAPVRVYWFNDRIEVMNPGGAFGVVTPENFGRPGVTDYRNPHLAEAMKVLGFVQKFGVGIQTANAELLKAGHPIVEFQVEPNNVLAIIRSQSR